MINIKKLELYLNQVLQPSLFKDYAPNGLQVAGCREVQSIVTAVSATQNIIHKAVERGADTIIVHHGYFWKGEDPCVVGMKRERLALLLKHNINLLAYHLPLDAHAEFGNNIQLGRALGIDVLNEWGGEKGGPDLCLLGEYAQPLSIAEFTQRVKTVLDREPFVIQSGRDTIASVGWCTGAAQDQVMAAANMGLDAYLTGEVSERTVHEARECGINFFAGGHHATERFGVKALAEHLREQLKIPVQFVDDPNPV